MTDEEGRTELQEALDGMCRWSLMWGMEFNVKKSKVMHFGRKNPRQDYMMNGQCWKKHQKKDIWEL